MDSLYHVVQFEQQWKDEMDRCESFLARRLKTNPSGDVAMPAPHCRTVRQRIERIWSKIASNPFGPRTALPPNSSSIPELEITDASGADLP
jgi:hypothetical protein